MSESVRNTLYSSVVVDFSKRGKFVAGLLITFIDFLRELGFPDGQVRSYEDFCQKLPPVEFHRGKKVNQLMVKSGGKIYSIRPHYNRIQAFFRVENARYDYPSSAPHSTQAWIDYTDWIGLLLQLELGELSVLRSQVVDYVLKVLPDQSFRAGSVKIEPSLFSDLIAEFDLTKKKGENSGAAFQGLVFGFIRADNPHLQVDISKVRTGSKRLQRVGDVDAWDGRRLAITAEVKQFVVTKAQAQGFKPFIEEGRKRGAIAMVVALNYESGAVEEIEEMGGYALSRADLARFVRIWDPRKQDIAVASLEYYVVQIEKSSVLDSRLQTFLAERRLVAGSGEE